MAKNEQIQLLISTMHQKDHTLLDKMRVDSDAVVVNQCDCESQEQFEYKGHHIVWINSTQRGLSRSRNMALQAATAEICVISDDDLEYRDGYAQMICAAFSGQPEADILRFQVRGIERTFKTYPENPCKLGYLGSMKISSVEVAFRREAVVRHGLRFDELIGAGTQFPMGEENTFLFACLRKKLRIFYVPQEIASLHIGDSSWFDGYTERYFYGRGAAFTAMDKNLAGVLMLQFVIRKYARYRHTMKPLQAIRLMRQGRKAYLTQKKNGKR